MILYILQILNNPNQYFDCSYQQGSERRSKLEIFLSILDNFIKFTQLMTQLPVSKRSYSLQQCNKTYSNFNSRLIIASPACQFRTTYLKMKTKNERDSHSGFDFNNQSDDFCHESRNIKSRIEKFLGKQKKVAHKNEGGQNKNIYRKMKSLFFKGNYKINRNKKELQELNKKKMAQIIKKQYQEMDRKNKSNIFIIKEIKPVKMRTKHHAYSYNPNKYKVEYEEEDEEDLIQRQPRLTSKSNTEGKTTPLLCYRTSKMEQTKYHNIKTAQIAQRKQVIQIFDDIQDYRFKSEDQVVGFPSQPGRYQDIERNIQLEIAYNTRNSKFKQKLIGKQHKSKHEDLYEPWVSDSNHEGFQTFF